MKICITGHRGFIGRHFAKRLAEMGHTIKGVDIKDGPQFDVRTWFRTPEAEEVFDLVIHCAAIVEGRCRGRRVGLVGVRHPLLQVDAIGVGHDHAGHDHASHGEHGGGGH